MNDPNAWAAVIAALAGLATAIGALWHSTNTRTKVNDHLSQVENAPTQSPGITIRPEDVTAIVSLINSVRSAISPEVPKA